MGCELPKLEWYELPVYITNFNNLERGFRRLVEWLQKAGMDNITVLDNASTYPPLLDYYKSTSISVSRNNVNIGPWAFWKNYTYKQMYSYYVVTDADVVPSPDCPMNLVKKMIEVFERYPRCKKVGAGIRTDNLPDHYARKQEVINHEEIHTKQLMPEGDCYRASIDTTFALYPALGEFSAPDPRYDHYRLAAPYLVEHVPWYEDTSNPTPEMLYYKSSTVREWSNW